MIKRTLHINNLVCDCFDVDSRQMVYMLIPMGLDADEMAKRVEQHQTNIVVISGMDWNNDLTPWSAPGVKPHDAAFGCNAKQFLSLLVDKIVSAIEGDLSMPITNRILLGTSLSGLFAMWAWSQSTIFNSIGSLSGSFWYDGFSEWFVKQPIINTTGKVYLSLGEKEAKSKAPRFGEVNDQTTVLVDYLSNNNIDVLFEYNPGNHFAPILPRIDKALSYLL